MGKRKRLACILISSALIVQSNKAYQIGLEVGKGFGNTRSLKIIGINWDQSLYQAKAMPSLSIQLNEFIKIIRPDRRSINVLVGMIPMVGYCVKKLCAEIGIGISYLHNRRIDKQKIQGSRVNFADRIGLVYALASDWEIKGSVLHVSNAGLKCPNPGLNLYSLSLSYRF